MTKVLDRRFITRELQIELRTKRIIKDIQTKQIQVLSALAQFDFKKLRSYKTFKGVIK